MRCAESQMPPGAIEKGRVVKPELLGEAIHQLAARAEVAGTRAHVAMSDMIASFRVMRFPPGVDNTDVEAAITTQLPPRSDRMAVRRAEIRSSDGGLSVYAVAWNRRAVSEVADAVRHAGLEPVVVELKSLCVARAVPLETCIVLDLSTEPCEALVVDNHVPIIWHMIERGANPDSVEFLATGLRPLLTFYKQATGQAFDPQAPILIRSEQQVSAPFMERLTAAAGHTVRPIPVPPRVPDTVSHERFLTCIGLVMRRE
jgi:hypothetical protein